VSGTIEDILNIFENKFERFYCALIFNERLMLVGGCNGAQLTA